MINRPIFKDTLNGFLMDSNEKVRLACLKISNDPLLKNGYHAIGFSQGSQFLRGVAQRCPEPPMKNLISIGGQHQGVYGKTKLLWIRKETKLVKKVIFLIKKGIPFCPLDGFVCRSLTRFVSYASNFNIIQRNFVQASYWHDPFDEGSYRDYNAFIADLNQEKVCWDYFGY
jgi:palmitoyl-protein thioesterase